MEHTSKRADRTLPLHRAARTIARWTIVLALLAAGLTSLLPLGSATADNIQATATVCVPGPDNFCPATPTPPALPLRLYLVAIEQSEVVQP